MQVKERKNARDNKCKCQRDDTCRRSCSVNQTETGSSFSESGTFIPFHLTCSIPAAYQTAPYIQEKCSWFSSSIPLLSTFGTDALTSNLSLQFDVVPPEVNMPFKNTGKKMTPEESTRKRSGVPVKISPWTLARLNAEEVSRAAAEAKKKSKILQPVMRGETLQGHETDSSFGSGSSRMGTRPNNTKKVNRRDRLPKNLPLEPLAKISNSSKRPPEASSSLAPLQLAARSAFQTSRVMSSTGVVASSPDSSLGSPDLHPFQVSSSGAEDSRGLMLLPSAIAATEKGAQVLRSTSSDGYEASGGEDSDRVPSRIVHRSVNWSNLLYNSGRGDVSDNSKVSSLAGL